MKRIIACLFLLCLIPIAFSCAYADGQINYQAMDRKRIKYILPMGMDAEVITEDGRLTVNVNSAKTDWNLLVNNADAEGYINIQLSAVAPDQMEIKNYHQINMGSEMDPQGGSLTEQAFAEFDIIVKDVFAKRGPTPIQFLERGNTWELARFDAQSSAVIPSPTDGDVYAAYLIAWHPENGSETIYEYYFIDIHFTDDAARKVTMSEIPMSRIFAHRDSSIKTEVEPGCVTYTIPLDNALCGNHIETHIAAPEGAKSWKLVGGKDGLCALTDIQVDGEVVSAAKVTCFVWREPQAQIEAIPIIWYADENGEELLNIEQLSMNIIVGNPVPFPRYNDELSAVPKSRLRPVISLNGKQVDDLPYISAVYAAVQSDYDTFRLSVIPSEVPSDVNLDNVSVDLLVLPPEGAVAYTMEMGGRNTIYGKMDNYFEDNFESNLDDPDMRRWKDDISTLQGVEYLYAGGFDVSRSTRFEHDPSLRLYIEGEDSGTYAGCVTIIYWYDSLEPSAKPILKEYLVRKMDPFTLETVEKAYTDESQLGDKLTIPVIILSKGEEITDLYLVIQRMPTSDPNHIYYDLYVIDAAGNEQKLGGDAIVIMPYPDERLGPDAPYSFKLAHYHNGKKLEYTEENGLLWRTEHGLAFKTKEFSPFILSWEEINAESIGQLPKTGDASLPVAMLLAVFAACAAGIYFLHKKRI